MHYYQHNIGDYRRDTGHLSLLEHGVYRQLLDMYYLSEQQIPEETELVYRRLCARTDEEKKAVDAVLFEFFKRDGGWSHPRCDAEIQAYHAKAGRARDNGKLGGRPSKTKVVISGNPEGTQTKANPITQEPINPRTHKPIQTSIPPTPTDDVILSDAAIAAVEGANHFPCPQDEIRALYAQKLPHLPQARVWGPDRQKELRARWVEASRIAGYRTRDAGLAWWAQFFDDFERCSIGHGTSGEGRVWVPDLQWIIKRVNFEKIVNGRYPLARGSPTPVLNRQEALEARNRAVVDRLLAKEAAEMRHSTEGVEDEGQ